MCAARVATEYGNAIGWSGQPTRQPTRREVNHHRPTWQAHAMNIARAAALRSEDPYCKVGATVLSDDHAVFGVGYNGTKTGVAIDFSDREARRLFMIHAEVNALRYVTPHLADSGLLAVTHFPCIDCVRLAGAWGIQEIVWQEEPDWSRYPAGPSMEVASMFGILLHHISLV